MKKNLLFILITLFLSCKKEASINDLSREKWNGKIKTITSSTYFYDSTKADPHLGELINKSIRTFNMDGNETSVTYVNKEDRVESIKQNSYNDKKQKISAKETDQDNNTLNSFEFKYDKNDLLVEVNTTDFTTNQKSKQINTFDPMRNLIGSISYKGDNEIDFKAENKYDDKNQLIEEKIFLPDGTMDYKAITSYDEKGRAATNTGYANDGTVIWVLKNDYKVFDKDGNWLLKNIIRDGKAINVVQVQIEYYP
ncbi:MAG: hypothetical protein ACKOX3_04040 [Bacteroidota bacterium]